jgi:hypothetical protein
MNYRVPWKGEELCDHLSDNQLLRKASSARSQQETQLLLNNNNTECVMFYMIGKAASFVIVLNIINVSFFHPYVI